ncbi:MAG TPA: LytTR family DNA-binding domain-containing protein [Parafilimonas sp.]|nr:LytTR family DNA-binding domain-containing protein [Parafilimonas sp.]
MINAILIDDEMHCLKTLDALLKEYCPEVHIVDKCSDAKTALKAIEKFKPELVFLDIEMPHMNGFEMLEQFSEISFAVVFTTSYDQYAIKAFRFSALDYLLKPVEPKQLIAAVHKIQSQKKLPEAEQFQMFLNKVHNKENIFPKIPIPTSDGYELIPAEQVLFCEADDNYTYFNLKNKKKIIACRMLKEVEEQLENFSFFVRIHHSYIVNIKEVSRYVRGEGGYVIMSDGSSVNVSRSRKETLLKWFMNKQD